MYIRKEDHSENNNKHSKAIENHAHHDHSKMIKDFYKRFWFSIFLTIPILVLSPMVQNLLNYSLFDWQPAARFLLFGLSTLIFFYGGWPFLKGLVRELSNREPGMMLLIGVAISVAWGYSSATVFGLKGSTFFWELATLIDVMLLGHWIEMKSVAGASRSLEKLVELMPSDAHLIDKSDVSDVKVEEIKKGDQLLVRPGEKVPVDGKIIKGESYLNESMISGESKPVKKIKGDKVVAGTINGDGSLTIEAENIGEDVYLQKVVKMVGDAQKEKSKTQNLADRIAFWLTIASLTIGFSTLGIWIIAGKPFVFALERMASVMVITCPHALGLAVPLVVAISTAESARKGLLVRNRTAFENSRKITLVAFDKTGTLTEGKFNVSRFVSIVDNRDDKEILKLAGAVEKNSEHPIAGAIMKKIKDEKLDIHDAEHFNNIKGKGIEADVKNESVKIVSPEYIHELNKKIPENVYKNENETVVFVVINEKLSGYIAMTDEIRKESYSAVETLKKRGIKVFMLTGDNKNVAENVSSELKLDGYFASVTPDQKLKKIKEFQRDEEFVAMTGDGINDAPALAIADIGIAVGSGTDIAAETADIILSKSDPKDIVSLIDYGYATFRKMIQNFIWATSYNILAIPLAAGVLYSLDILINPALGAVFMSLSTVIVAFNAKLLKYKMK